MSHNPTFQCRAPVLAAGGGLLAALLLAAGCGHAPKSAPAAAPKPAPAKAAVAVVTNTANEYASVFEDLSSPAGKDPFFPTSHRRDPVAAPNAEPVVSAESDLLLKGIIHAGKHSQAVINNRIFEVNDDQRVTVANGTKVEVRCVEIGGDYVRVQMNGGDTITLQEKK